MVGDNILYVGTPVQVNYGEGVKKGICILTIHLDPMPAGEYSLEWFSIRVPKKIVKTVSLSLLDRWVHQRFHDLVDKYSLRDILTNIKTKGGSKTEGFETITNLYSNKEVFSSLSQTITNDRFLDSLRLQVMVNVKLSNTVLKNIINKVRELPLGVQQIYLTDVNDVNNDRSEEDSTHQEERKGWLELYLETVAKDESKRNMLNEILNNLSKKT
jgi:nitrogen regulatory protein PII